MLHEAVADVVSSFSGPLLVGASIVFLTLLWSWARDETPYSGFPIVGKEKDEWLNTKAKRRFLINGTQILKRGFEEHKGPFQVIAPHGPVIILPQHMTDEIRNNEHLSFTHASRKMFIGEYEGLEGFRMTDRQNDIFQAVIRQNLTQSIGSMTPDLATATSQLLPTLLPTVTTTTKETWTPVPFAQLAPVIAATLSARVFLGEPLCADAEWLRISITYTHNVAAAVQRLRPWPPFLWPVAHRFMREFAVLRAQTAAARRIIGGEVAARRRQRREEAMLGKSGAAERRRDSLEWLDQQARGDAFDAAVVQLLMSFVAIHTTSLTLVGIMYDLVAHPEYVERIRREVAEVLREGGGWKKTSLYKMKLLDSCMKESQRLHTSSAILMNRKVLQTVTLSDGTRLPKNAMVGVPTWPMRSLELYDDPARFDGDRFLRLRQQPGMESRGQFVATTPEHIGFGHGKHACPGRFFASNEIKVALVYLLMNYDWKFEEGKPLTHSTVDAEWIPDPDAKVLVRPRVPEIDLDQFTS